MRIAQHTIAVARPQQQVFDYFADFSNAPRWRMYVESMELVSPPPLGAGSRFRFVMMAMGEKHLYEAEVLEFDRPRLWKQRLFEGHFRTESQYLFEAEGRGTRVTMTLKAKPIGLYGWLAVPILWLRGQKLYAEQLPGLKRALEEE